MSLPAGAELVGLAAPDVRHGFIRKVYGILGGQMVLTTLIGSLIMRLGESLSTEHPAVVLGMLFASLAMSVIMMFVFACCPDTTRQYPINYVLLGLFTVAESIMVGFICVQFTQASVLIALGLTAFIVLALTLFAFQTKVDFTGMGPYLYCAILVLLGFSFILWIVGLAGLSSTSPAFRTLHLLYAAVGALLFSAYIVFDTQLIVGGKHRTQFSVDDYVLAAMSLYMDIVQLFLYLLQLFGERR